MHVIFRPWFFGGIFLRAILKTGINSTFIRSPGMGEGPCGVRVKLIVFSPLIPALSPEAVKKELLLKFQFMTMRCISLNKFLIKACFFIIEACFYAQSFWLFLYLDVEMISSLIMNCPMNTLSCSDNLDNSSALD